MYSQKCCAGDTQRANRNEKFSTVKSLSPVLRCCVFNCVFGLFVAAAASKKCQMCAWACQKCQIRQITWALDAFYSRSDTQHARPEIFYGKFEKP